MSMVTEIPEAQFETDVLGQDGTVVVDFYGDDCNVCVAVAGWFEDWQDDIAVPIRKIKLSSPDSALAAQFGIRSIPTLIQFENGEEVDRITGQISMSKVRAMVGAS